MLIDCLTSRAKTISKVNKRKANKQINKATTKNEGVIRQTGQGLLTTTGQVYRGGRDAKIVFCSGYGTHTRTNDVLDFHNITPTPFPSRVHTTSEPWELSPIFEKSAYK